MPETGSIVMAARVPKLTGIEPSLNEIVRMLLEKWLKANGKRR